MPDPAKVIETLKTELEKASKLAATLQSSSTRMLSDLKKLPAPTIKLTGLQKAYMDAIRKSDGLTSARPATMKAVQEAEKKPSSVSVGKARDELAKHVADLKKASGKDKKFAKFEKRMEDLGSQIDKLL